MYPFHFEDLKGQLRPAAVEVRWHSSSWEDQNQAWEEQVAELDGSYGIVGVREKIIREPAGQP